LNAFRPAGPTQFSDDRQPEVETGGHAPRPSFLTFSDPDGNGWLLQELTTRFPGRIDSNETTFGFAPDLASAMRRASVAHGEHEKRIGEADANWPD
jgi:hypothetical protein